MHTCPALIGPDLNDPFLYSESIASIGTHGTSYLARTILCVLPTNLNVMVWR
jgi:hypothetical protein